MYIVVACPRCNLARTAREDQRTAGCPRCGYRIDIRRSRIHHRTDDMAEAARALARVNEGLAGPDRAGGSTWGDLRPDIASVDDGTRPVRTGQDILSLARVIFARSGPFTTEDLAHEADIPVVTAGKKLAGWSADGLLFSPSPGLFAFVDP